MDETRIQIAKPDIVRYFDEFPRKVLKLSDIASVLAEQRGFWRLTQKTTTRAFVDFLTRHAKLKRFDFPFPYRKEHRYAWGDVVLLEVVLTLKQQAYFTHYTAVRMHGLTEQVPKTVYLNHEQPRHAQSSELVQGRIDAAFRHAPRVSRNVIDYEEIRICLINGMHTGQLGVVEEEVAYDAANPVRLRFTDVERTLIDVAVRPFYAGGVFEVLKAYRIGRDRVSTNRLAAALRKLGYVYPYHQAIGFYLERAGYKPSSLDLLRRFPMEFDFYLTHQMGDTDYVKDWRLHVPKGF